MTEKITRAILRVNGANFLIFEGLNPIGRFQKATVILRDPTISQSQAVIVVVNEHLHFISDTFSSNGTYLNNTRLVPLQLYALSDDCTINFAGIKATYKKVIDGENVDATEISSFDVQECSQSVFNRSTQLLENTLLKSQIAVESVTPAVEFNIHEVETEVSKNTDLSVQIDKPTLQQTKLCSETTNILDIHDVPTQILETTNDTVISTEQAIKNHDDTSTTDNESDNETSILKIQNKSSRQTFSNIVVEETILESSKVDESLNQHNETSDDSNASLDLMLIDTQYPHITVQNPTVSPSSTQESTLKVNLLKKKGYHRIKSDTDSETDIDEIENNTDISKTNKSTDSDTEERLHLSQLRRRTRQLLKSDSEDEDAIINNKNDTNNSVKMNDSDVVPATQHYSEDRPCFNILSHNSKNSIVEKELEVITTQSSSSSMEGFKLGLTQFFADAQPKTNSTNCTLDSVEIKNPNSEENQTVKAQEVADKYENNSSVNVPEKETEKTDDDNCAQSVASKENEKEIENDVSSVSIQNNKIFEQQTQTEDSVTVNRQEKIFTETANHAEYSKSNEQKDSLIAQENVLSCPTRKICAQNSEKNILSPLESCVDIYNAATQKVCNEIENIENNDQEENSLFLLPTQRIPLSVNLSESNVYNAPTQKICSDELENMENSNQEENNLFLLPTQRLSMPIDTNEDDIYNAPTQKICVDKNESTESNNQEENDLYLLPTQKISLDTNKDDVYNAPTQKICISKIESNNQEGNEIFLLPTQKISVSSDTNENDVHNEPTQPICNNETESNYETEKDLLFLSTQPLSDKQQTQKIEKNVVSTQLRPSTQNLDDVESQLEAIFKTQTITFTENDANRPSNPLVETFEKIDSEVVTATTPTTPPGTPVRKSARQASKQERRKTIENNSLNKNLQTVKHKLQNETDVNSLKKIKLHTDVEAQTEEISDNNKISTRKQAKPIMKKTTKSGNLDIYDEIKVVTRKKMQQKDFQNASVFVNNINGTILDKKTRTRKAKETSDKTVTNSSSSNNISAERISDSSSEETRPTLKRRANTSAISKTPVKKTRTRILESTVSLSSCSTDESFTSKSGQTTAEENTFTLKTPERAKRKQKPKVVFTMFESPELESAVRQLGGSMVDTIDTSTVLVTEKVKRTQKLLMAVGQGKPICPPEWIRKCKKAGEFLDPWNHILIDKEAEKKWKFSLKESLIRSQKRNLFEGYNVVLVVNNAIDVLKGAVESCGGKCFTKAPSKNVEGQLVVVSTADNKSKYNKYLKQNPKPLIVAPEAIFDGVLRQELHFEDHLLA